MAVLQSQTQQPQNLQIHRLPQSKFVDAVRWLSPFSAFDKFVVLSLFDPNSSSSTIELHSLDFPNSENPKPILSPLSSSSPSLSRTSSLKTSQSLIAFSTFSGSLDFLSPNYSSSGEVTLDSSLSLQDDGFHVGPISCIDVLERECVSVGEDGRVNLVSFGGGKTSYRRVFDSDGLVSYTAVESKAMATSTIASTISFKLTKKKNPFLLYNRCTDLARQEHKSKNERRKKIK